MYASWWVENPWSAVTLDLVTWLIGLRATAACFSTFLLVLVTFDIAVRGGEATWCSRPYPT
jgi:hypothetical protein